MTIQAGVSASSARATRDAHASRSRLYALEPFIVRRRLLELLPDDDGFVLWLSAPYGYGKSVLLAQWAAGLERSGRGVVWLSAERDDVRTAIAAQLALPSHAPWPLICDELLRRDCAVVIEEAEAAGEDLDRLLGGFGGLVALASRGELPSLELPRRLTQRRLVRLGEAEMAFTPAEVETLSALLSAHDAGASQAEALELWRSCNGWPLALHFALLSGGAPALDGLARSLAQALPFELRAELLLLAAVGELPRGAGDGLAVRLVERGLAQELAHAYRLHPLFGETLLRQHRDEAAEQVRAARGRLPWELWAAALARLGSRSELAQALEEGDSLAHAGLGAERWLTWHAMAPGASGRYRRLAAAAARITLTDFAAALPELLTLLPDSSLAADDRVSVAARGVTALAVARRIPDARAVAAAAAGGVEEASPATAWSFRYALATLCLQSGELEDARQRLTELVTEAAGAGVGHALSLSAEMMLYMTRFELDGDHLAYIAALRGVLASRPDLGPREATTLHHNLGIQLASLGDMPAAREHLSIAAETADRNRRLVVGMALAYVDRDLARFPQLLAESRLWEYDMLSERVAALWLRALRAKGDEVQAAEVARGLPEGPFVLIEKAWLAHVAGDHALAAERLEKALPAWKSQDSIVNRDFHQQHAAMEFIVHGGAERLEALLALSAHRERMLPCLLVPLSSLPRDRPELSVHYPLEEVLASGWEEAVRLRQADLPPLRLRLLGNVSVCLFGEELRLGRRHRELITLMALKVPRGRWAEELWPEAAPKRSENNLRVQLHLLKRELTPLGAKRYLPGDELLDVDSDLARLSSAIEAGDADAVSRLYTGELASDIDLPLVAAERSELATRVVATLRRAAATAGPEDAHRHLARVLEIDPFNEDVLRELLAGLLAAGRRSAAERMARDFAERLESETGYGLSDHVLELLKR